ncbi:MAG: right-handed parallel beta-helix repeat-containing protein, partial [Bacteroidia bacterium]
MKFKTLLPLKHVLIGLANFSFTLILVLSVFWSNAAIIYTDSSATGLDDGTSWTNAYNELQDAIDGAAAGDTIWVAQGTYFPTESPDGVSTDARDRAFHLDKNLVILGGFDGSETSHTQRDFEGNSTILSGDIGTTNDSTDNSYHVFINSDLDSSAVIDGFTINEGNADVNSTLTYSGRSFNRRMGGGIFNHNSHPKISNCRIINNTAVLGGGMRNISSSVMVSDCEFADNIAESGGAINSFNPSTPKFTHTTFLRDSAENGGACFNNQCSPIYDSCTFTENKASSNGGALNNTTDSEPIVRNSVFTSNTATSLGGAINTNANAEIEIENCVFDQNEAENGGAFSLVSADGTVTNSVFTNNATTADGGGVRVWSNSSASLTNCTFSENVADGDGGAILLFQGSQYFKSCVFEENHANSGGAISSESNTLIELDSCIFYSNAVSNNGGAMVNDGVDSLTMNRCIFIKDSANYGGAIYNLSCTPIIRNTVLDSNVSVNRGGGVYNQSTATPEFTNCIISRNRGTEGAGVYSLGECNFYNSTFYTNEATVNYGGLYSGSGSSDVHNCILGTNSVNGVISSINSDLYLHDSSNFTYNIVRTSNPYSANEGVQKLSIYTSIDFSKATDLDGADNEWLTKDDGLIPRRYSAAINYGNTGLVDSNTTKDITGGIDRIRGSAVDLGAYELDLVPDSVTRLYVNSSRRFNTSQDGTSWATAFSSLQTAMNFATEGDTIWVKQGLHAPELIPGYTESKDRSFYLDKNIKIFGGFVGNETEFSQRSLNSSNQSILSGNAILDYYYGPEISSTSKCYHVFITTGLTDATEIDGFEISGGAADGPNT